MATKEIKFGFYEPDYQQVETLKKYSEKELRKEYSRLRSIARKRLERFSNSPFASKSEIYKQYKNRFVPVENVKSIGKLRKLTKDVYYYLERKTGSLSGYKSYLKDTLSSFKEKGYTWISMNNIHDVFKWMENARSQYVGDNFDSDRALRMYRAGEKKGMTPEELEQDFMFWYNNFRDLEKIPKNANRKRTSAKQLRGKAARRTPVSRRKKNAPRR